MEMKVEVLHWFGRKLRKHLWHAWMEQQSRLHIFSTFLQAMPPSMRLSLVSELCSCACGCVQFEQQYLGVEFCNASGDGPLTPGHGYGWALHLYRERTGWVTMQRPNCKELCAGHPDDDLVPASFSSRSKVSILRGRCGVSCRYAPATQLWRGRLHVMGGSKEDRQQPAREHWSISVRNGEALEAEWRDEIPIPRGGPHRACVVVEDGLYVIGGQEGDFKAKPGSPNFKCSRQKEVVYGDVYKLEKGARRWKELPPMIKPISHIEFAWVTFNRSIVIVGGSTMNNPVTKKMVLLGDIFQFDTHSKVWKKLGQMPYRGKTVLTAYWEGWLYFTAGQRDKGPADPAPRKIMAKTWRTKLAI